MKINLNDQVVVRLTEHGLKTLKEYYGRDLEWNKTEDGSYKFQLYEIGRIFHKDFITGGRQAIENNEIILLKD